MYNIFISAGNNLDLMLHGTGFLGIEVSSFDDVVDALHKYATYKNKDGKLTYYNYMKISFCYSSTIKEFKAKGDLQCEEKGFVELFSLAILFKSDPLTKLDLFGCPTGWIDNNGEFKWVIKDETGNLHPQYGKKLRTILHEIDVKLIK